MLYMVLGMHKSGTTLVSQILSKSGIWMGSFDENIGYDQGNHYERPDVIATNLHLVECSARAYHSLDHYRRHPGPLPDKAREMMLEIVEGQAAGQAEQAEHGAPDWGIKEPLCCLTYHLWNEVLPPHRLIAIYRDPTEVLNHYRSRTPRGAWRALRAWSNYNRCVLAALRESTSPGLLIHYGELMRGDDEFHRLEEFLGRKLSDCRRSGAYRASSDNRLYAPVNWAMAKLEGASPAETLRELEELRAGQLS